MLEKTQIAVPFNSGIDEKVTSQLLEPGSQASVTNGVFTKNGSIRKRYGTRKLGDMPNAKRLATYRDELVAYANIGAQSTFGSSTRLFPYATSQSAFGPTGVGLDDIPEANVTRQAFTTSASGITNFDVATSGTIRCVVWTADVAGAGSRPCYQFFDVATGSPLGLPQTFVAAARYVPRVFVCGAFFVATFTDNANNIYGARASLTAPLGVAFSAPVVLTNNAVAGVSSLNAYDAQPIAGTSNFALASENAAAGGLNVMIFVAATFATTANATFGADALLSSIAVTGTSGEYVWAAYSRVNVDHEVKVVGLNPATLGVTVPLAIAYTMTNYRLNHSAQVTLKRTSAHAVLIASSAVANNTGGITNGCLWIQQWQDVAGGTPLGPLRTTRNIALISRPWAANGHYYLVACYAGSAYATTAQGTAYVVDTWAHDTSATTYQVRPVAVIAPTLVTSTNYSTASVVSVIEEQSGVFLTGVSASLSGTKHTAISSVAVDFATQRYVGTEYGPHLYTAMGLLAYYDGAMCGEAGFLYYPEGITHTLGVGVLNGVYQYLAVYEYYDSNGQWHQSAPSVPISTVNLVNAQVTLTIPTYTLSMRFGPAKFAAPRVGIALYRTIGNGSTFYRLAPDDLPAALINDPTVEDITYTDNLSDASLQDGTHAIYAYVNGQLLPNACPPASSTCCVWNSRLWLAGGDDTKNVWFSKLLSDGDAPAFTSAFIVRFDEDIVAVAPLDSQLIAWSERSIFVLRGDGPDDAGGGGAFTTPERVTADVGCIEPRSIVRVQDGYLFQSAGGIYLLTRALEVIYHGHNVEDTLTTYSTVTSAVLLDDQAQQRIGVRNGAGIGKTICYDDVQKAWSIFQYQNAAGSLLDAISATKWGSNGYAFTDGVSVWLEDKTTYYDEGTRWVTLTVETAWMRGQYVAAYYRFWQVILTMERTTLAFYDLRMSLAYDYESTYAAGYTWSDATLQTVSVNTRTQVAQKPQRQKAQAIRVKINDAPPTGGGVATTGVGPYLIAVDWIMGIKKGGAKLPAAARV